MAKIRLPTWCNVRFTWAVFQATWGSRSLASLSPQSCHRDYGCCATGGQKVSSSQQVCEAQAFLQNLDGTRREG
eukprot:6457557-Amphidinium_carterae.2